MKTIINRSFIVALLLTFSTAVIPYIAFAEEDQPIESTESTDTEEDDQDASDIDENDPPPPPDDEDPDAPIDGGVGILIATGIGYGVKKIHQARKKQHAQAK
jgi:hypothetical protein